MNSESNNTSLSNNDCYYSDEFDSGIVSSDLSSFSAITYDVEQAQEQGSQAEQELKETEEQFVVDALKRKIVELNVQLSNINQENRTLQTELQLQTNQVKYFKQSSEWNKNKLIICQADNMRLSQEVLDKTTEVAKSNNVIRMLECDTQKWLAEVDRLKLQNRNKHKLLMNQVDSLERDIKEKQLSSDLYSDNVRVLSDNYQFKMKFSENLIAAMKKTIIDFEYSVIRLNNEISELTLKNCNLEKILGKNESVIRELELMTEPGNTFQYSSNNYLSNCDTKQENNRSATETGSKIYLQQPHDAENALQNESDMKTNITDYCTVPNDISYLHLKNEELNKLLKLKQIEMKDKINRYEVSMHTLLRKVGEYRKAKQLAAKTTNTLQTELNILKSQFSEIVVDNSVKKQKLFTNNAIIKHLKSNTFKVTTELYNYKKLVQLLLENCDKIRLPIKYSKIDMLINKSYSLDESNTLSNNDINKEISAMKDAVKLIQTNFEEQRLVI